MNGDNITIEYLKSHIKRVRLKVPVKCFDCFVLTKTTEGYLIDDKFIPLTYPIILFANQFVNKELKGNAGFGLYPISELGEYTVLDGFIPDITVKRHCECSPLIFTFYPRGESYIKS